MSKVYTHRATLDYLIDLNNKSKLSNQYIFSGKNGIGKKKVAMELSKIILNTDYVETHPDFMMIKRDKIIKVSDISECNKFLSEKPITANKKVLIIDDAHMMNVNSANKFLKTFEETPEYTHVFLITDKKNSLLDTIISRAVIMNFVDNTIDDITSYLSSEYDQAFATEIASISGGSIGFALNIIDDKTLYDVINMPFEVISYIQKGQKLKIVEISSKVEDDYIDIFLNQLRYFFRDIFMIKINDNKDLLYYKGKSRLLKDYAIRVKKDKLEEVMEIINDAQQRIKANCNKQIVIYTMLLNIYEELK